MALKRILLAAAAAGALLPTGALAQDVQMASADDIVVTALKRDTTIQETPISISAVTGESLANAGVQNIADLSASTPSLDFVDGGPSFRRVVIRGIQAPGEPMVGTYYDETPVTGVVGAGNDAGGSTPELRLFDVERVEVLRGPQGTLYGSGSMGGTLRIIYNKPKLDRIESAVDANLSNTAGGGWNWEANGMVNLPIAGDQIGLRVVGYYRHNDGYIDNVPLGINNINSLKSWGGHFDLRMKPNERWTFDVATYLSRTSTDTSNWDLQAGKYNSLALTRQPVRDKVELYSVTSNYDLDFANFVATGSYMHRDLSSVGDVSRYMTAQRIPSRCSALVTHGPDCSTEQLDDFYALVDGAAHTALFPQQEMDAWTAELRLDSSGNGPIHWTAGGFYSNRSVVVLNPQVRTDPVTGWVLSPVETVTSRQIDDHLSQKAAFGELSWDVTSRFNLTGGARYFQYDKEIYGETTVPFLLVGARITPRTRVASSENGWVFRANASYKLSRDVMLYAEAAQGFRPGGANQVLGLADALTGYGSDSLWNYEAGLKTQLFDRRMTFNIDGFQINWSDMQISQRTPDGAFSYIGNAGRARVRGLEIEGSLRPAEGLSLGGNFSYIDARLSEDQNTGTVATSGLKGDRIPNVPQVMAGGSAQYSRLLTPGLSGVVRGDFNYVGSSWSDFRPTYVYARHVDPYTLVNARIGVEEPDGKWGIYLFATNLLNSTAINRATASAISTGNNLAIPGRTSVHSATPRTVGVNLRAGF